MSEVEIFAGDGEMESDAQATGGFDPADCVARYREDSPLLNGDRQESSSVQEKGDAPLSDGIASVGEREQSSGLESAADSVGEQELDGAGRAAEVRVNYVICDKGDCSYAAQRFVLEGSAKYCPQCGDETRIVEYAPENAVAVRVPVSQPEEKEGASGGESAKARREVKYVEDSPVLVRRISERVARLIGESSEGVGIETHTLRAGYGTSFYLSRSLEPERFSRRVLFRQREYSRNRTEYLGLLACSTDNVGNVLTGGEPLLANVGKHIKPGERWALLVYGRHNLSLLRPVFERVAGEFGVNLDVRLQTEDEKVIIGEPVRVSDSS